MTTPTNSTSPNNYSNAANSVQDPTAPPASQSTFTPSELANWREAEPTVSTQPNPEFQPTTAPQPTSNPPAWTHSYPQPNQSPTGTYPAPSPPWPQSAQVHSQAQFPSSTPQNFAATPLHPGFSAAPASPFAPRPSVRVPLLIWGLILIIGGLALGLIMIFPTVSGSLLFIGMLLLLGICLLAASFVTLRRK